VYSKRHRTGLAIQLPHLVVESSFHGDQVIPAVQGEMDRLLRLRRRRDGHAVFGDDHLPILRFAEDEAEPTRLAFVVVV